MLQCVVAWFLLILFLDLSIKFFSFLLSSLVVVVIFTWRSRNHEKISYAKWVQKTKKIVNILCAIIFKEASVPHTVVFVDAALCRCFITKLGFSLFAFNFEFVVFNLSLTHIHTFSLSNFDFCMWFANYAIFFVCLFSKCIMSVCSR